MSDLTMSPSAAVESNTGNKRQRTSPRRGSLRHLWSKAGFMPRLYIVTFVAVILLAIFGPMLIPFDPNAQTLLARLRPPVGFDRAMPIHPFGTDELGRDILSRTVSGLRLTLLIALLGSMISLVIGVLVGVISGYFRGRIGAFLVGLIDIQMAVPFTLIALLTIAMLGKSLLVLISVIGLSGWEIYARMVRAQVLSVSKLPFVEASRAAGASHLRILLRHVLPNVVSPIIVVWTMTFSSLILLESSLSFLGLGVQPPTATLGSMVGAGRDYLATAPWVAVTPSLAIMLISLLVLLVGDWLRDALDVRLK
jgi:peptide/nickel transport system permease protein